MKLTFHGGLCCGIKTLHGFYRHGTLCDAEVQEERRNNDKFGEDVSTEEPFFTDAAPEEDVVDRFKRLIEFCKKRRPKGAIDVTLVKSQQKEWLPLLEEYGFKEVASFINSNSSNRVYVYYLTYGQPEDK